MAKKANKRSNGDGNIRQRANGSWEGRYVVGINPGNGKPIRKSVYGKTKPEVAEKLRAITAAIDKGEYLEPVKITVRQWFEIWLTDYMAEAKPLTIQQYRSMAETHIIPALGAVKLSKLTRPQVQKFFNQLAVDGMTTRRKNPETGKMEVIKKTSTRINPETGKTETVYYGLSPKTIRNIHDIFSLALTVAVDQGYLRENVASRCKLPKVIEKEIIPLSEAQQLEFLNSIKGHVYENLFYIYIFCGLRESEAIGLTWDCVDLKTGAMKIYRQWQRVPGNWSEFRFEPLKNNKTRSFVLSPFVIEVLKKQQKKQRLDKLAAGLAWEGFDNLEEQEEYFIFTDKYGKPLNPAPVYEAFKKIAADIGVPAAYIHTLRHTCATNDLAEGDSPKTVQNKLGHHDAAFTLNKYGHASQKMIEDSALRQQAMIERMGLGTKKEA